MSQTLHTVIGGYMNRQLGGDALNIPAILGVGRSAVGLDDGQKQAADGHCRKNSEHQRPLSGIDLKSHYAPCSLYMGGEGDQSCCRMWNMSYHVAAIPAVSIH